MGVGGGDWDMPPTLSNCLKPAELFAARNKPAKRTQAGVLPSVKKRKAGRPPGEHTEARLEMPQDDCLSRWVQGSAGPVSPRLSSPPWPPHTLNKTPSVGFLERPLLQRDTLFQIPAMPVGDRAPLPPLPSFRGKIIRAQRKLFNTFNWDG